MQKLSDHNKCINMNKEAKHCSLYSLQVRYIQHSTELEVKCGITNL